MTLADLRKEFAARGWQRKATGRVLAELAIHVSVAAAGGAAFLVSENLLVRLCGLIVLTAGSIGVGTNTHTSSHYATSEKRWLNELLTYFGYPFFLGLAATHWWHRHVVIHHPSPNVIGVDGDADLMPWFAMTAEEIAASRGWRRFYYRRLQWWVFPLALAGNGFQMQRSGWRHLLQMLRAGEQRRSAHWFDLAALALHYAVFLGLPLLWFPAGKVLEFYVLRIGLMGYAMFAVLAPGHFPDEAARVSRHQKDSDYLLLQTAGTVNFRTGWLGRLLCSGLEYQIEHHLFPNFSHVFYPKMSATVKYFCQEHGLPYRCYSWGWVLWKCWDVLRRPQRIEEDLEALRLQEVLSPH